MLLRGHRPVCRSHASLGARALRLLPALTLIVTVLPLGGQETQPVPQDHPYTLHVYNNLMQFPTIVLGNDLRPLPPIPPEKFSITLDGGPPFHPTLLRREGDDAIALAVVLDASGDQHDMVQSFAEAFAHSVPDYLHPTDHVSIYAQDCKLMRSVNDQPASPETIRVGIAKALSAPGLHGGKSKGACGNALHLWDTVVVVAHELAAQPGRRVILIVSQGREAKSATGFREAANYVAARGASVFGLRDEDEWRYYGSTSSFSARSFNLPSFNEGDDDLFSMMCSRNGGMVLYVKPRELTTRLQKFITLLRERYIVEFPPPNDVAGAFHNIVITVPGINTFVRTTGNSSTVPDPVILADPTTLPSPASPAKFGTRRPLDPKH